MTGRSGEASRGRRTAILLPGQGSQHVGMGRALAERHREAAAVFEEGEEVLDLPLRRLAWEGSKEELTRTENAQPAILTHSYAVWRCLPERLRKSVVVAAGHSLGEFTAYLLAGALRFPDALRLVRRRGELMARSKEGTMAAVLGLGDEQVERVCEETEEGVVVAANFNAPGQVVISGAADAVESASRRAEEAGARRVIRLPVSGAFHSPLMAVARDGLGEALGATPLSPPDFPVVANVSASPVTDPEEARRLLVRQLTAPVRWVESVMRMREFAPDAWLEIGPGSVLTGLTARIDRSLPTAPVGDPESLEEQMTGATDE